MYERLKVVPKLELFADRWLRVCCYLSMLTPLLVTPWLFYPYTFGKSVYFFTLVIAAAPWYLFLIARQPLARPRASLILYALIVYISIFSISTIFSYDPSRSFWGIPERMTGFWPFLHYALFFLIASAVFRGNREFSRLIGFSVLASFLVALIAFVQKLNPALVLQEQGERVGSLLSNPAFLGEYLVVSIFFSLWLLRREKGLKPRAGLILVLSVQCGALLLTETRGPILAFYFGLFLFLVINATQRMARRRRLIYAVAASFMLFSPVVIVSAIDSSWIERVPGLSRFAESQSSSATVEARLINWQVAIDAFKERPITGWGPETYFHAFNKHYDPQIEQLPFIVLWFDHPHNKPLEQLSDGGLIGGIGYLACVLLVLSHLILGWRRQLIDLDTFSLGVAIGAAYLVASFFLFDHPVGLLMLSTSLAWWHSAAVASTPAAERFKPTNTAQNGATVIVLLMAIAFSATYWFATVAKPAWVSRQMRHAASLSTGDFDQSALELAALLSVDQQYRSHPAEWYAKTMIRHSRSIPKPDSKTVERLKVAHAALLEIGAAGPTHGLRALLMASLQLELAKADPSHLDLALSDIDSALAASPTRRLLLSTKARILRLRGDYHGAAQILQTAVNLYPVSIDAWRELGTAQFQAGEHKEARASLRKARRLETAPVQPPLAASISANRSRVSPSPAPSPPLADGLLRSPTGFPTF